LRRQANYHFTITPWFRFVAWQGAWKLLSSTDRWEIYKQQIQSGKAAIVPSDDEDDSIRFIPSGGNTLVYE